MSSKNKRPAASRAAPNYWPIALIAGGLTLLGLIAFAVMQAVGAGKGAAVPVEVSGQPSIKIDKQAVDLGDIPLGQTVEVTFTVANVGDRQLRFVEAPYVELVEGC